MLLFQSMIQVHLLQKVIRSVTYIPIQLPLRPLVFSVEICFQSFFGHTVGHAGTSVPGPGSGPPATCHLPLGHLQWKQGVLTTRPSGKSQKFVFKCPFYFRISLDVWKSGKENSYNPFDHFPLMLTSNMLLFLLKLRQKNPYNILGIFQTMQNEKEIF